MASPIEVVIPDLGDVDDVQIVEILVEPGDRVEVEDSLLTLESDKASMEVPSPSAGTVRSVEVSVGDSAAEGTVILLLDPADAEADRDPEDGAAAAARPAGETSTESEKSEAESGFVDKGGTSASSTSAETSEGESASTATSIGDTSDADLVCQLLVLGSGPGGYTAAFRGADLGLDTVMVERYPSLGGVCLNVGCIPSKALLHVAKVLDETRSFGDHGIRFGEPEIDLDRLREWKNGVVDKLTGGIASMAKMRKVRVVQGKGTLVGPHRLRVEGPDGSQVIAFEHAILAAGSRPVKIPGFPYDDERLVDSTGALELRDVPERLLVIGGGIIGLEMATVYHSLGSEITVVELLPGIMPGADRDLVRPLLKRSKARYARILTNTKVTSITSEEQGLRVDFEGEGLGEAPTSDHFDRVLLSVGRRPNGHEIGADAAGVEVDERGFVEVDSQMRTNVAHIFAIGDLVGQPMLAHKATHEGKVAAEVAAGQKSHFDARVIASVAYTDPEVAWVGLTEEQAKAEGRSVGKGVFPWSASGRSLAQGRSEGMTKLLFDEATDRVLGGGIVGPHAGDLIAEVALAIEMGCEAADIGLTIHPHPTLSESVGMAAEAFEGTITDLLPKKRKSKG